MKTKNIFSFLMLLLVLIAVPMVAAEDDDDDDDITLFGFELEELLNLASGMLAFILCVLTLIAFKRTGRTRLVYVGAALFLFAIKGFLAGSELFFDDIAIFDPLIGIADFIIILLLFIGVIKK